jgi:hypothetical protein
VTIALGGMGTQPLTSRPLVQSGVAGRTGAPDARGLSVTVSAPAVPGDCYRMIVETQTGPAFSNPIGIVGGP